MDSHIEFINSLKEHARRKAVSINDLFDDYDPKQIGKVTHHQFHQILSALAMWIDESKLNALIQPYSDGNIFNYKEFLSVEKNTSLKPSLTIEELKEFGQSFLKQRIPVIDYFQQFDPYHIGRISINNFLRASMCRPELTQKVIQVYKFPMVDEVDYLTLSNDISNILKQVQNEIASGQSLSSVLSSTSKTHNNSSNLSIKDLPFFSQVCESIRASGLNLKNQFITYDRYRHNKVSQHQFSTILQQIGIKLSPHQITQLVDHFSDEVDSNYINYALFCQEVQQYLTENKPKESHPFELVNLKVLLSNIAFDLRNRHSSLIDTMKYFDPHNTGTIPIIRFARAFTTSNLNLTPHEIKALENEFRVDDTNIDYQRFIENVLPLSPHSNIDAILERLKIHLSNQYLTFEPYLRRADRSNTGLVTLADTLSAFRNVSFDINDQEHQLLKNEYGLSHIPTIQISEFCAKVDTKRNAPQQTEKTPENNIPVVFTRSSYTSKPIRTSPPEEILLILHHIWSLSEQTKVDIYQQLRQIDYLKQGTILNTRFRNILMSIGTKEAEVKSLIEFYSEGPDIINYNNFYTDMKKEISSNPQTQESRVSNDTQQILIAIKGKMESMAMSVDSFFNKYDTTNSYRVLKSRVPGILHSIGINQPNQSQLQNFIHDFGDQRLQEMFNYKKLIDILDEMKISNEELASLKLDTTTAQCDKEIASLINSIRERLISRRKSPAMVFNGCNPMGISSREFRERISESGLFFMEADMQKLLRLYRCNYNGDVDWVTFCRNVESSKTVQMEF
ncbi:hypothetical protein TRFO_16425 [Tritrichomonas foetus]|uniref:EF hand family protein n=1 Tax=Tritrichomonas foetus TaxID=1144522 RepID=A0A1J4KVA1_9EUKA|nr:hypothetical protein TRFO_16425 [Tritrichomonas foetus]|eukprot:OHT13437.1 hypothetical protein TRFO_16425 [Tritrichomonas foetus]